MLSLSWSWFLLVVVAIAAVGVGVVVVAAVVAAFWDFLRPSWKPRGAILGASWGLSGPS